MSSSTWVQERSESGEWSSLTATTRASAGEWGPEPGAPPPAPAPASLGAGFFAFEGATA